MIASEIAAQIPGLRESFARIQDVMQPQTLQEKAKALERESLDPALWNDAQHGERVTTELARVRASLTALQEIGSRLDDLEVLLELARELADSETVQEAKNELHSITNRVQELEVQTMLSGEYDSLAAVMTIRSGAGGVDAADFALMLQRMYLRWAEKAGFRADILETSYAEEAGIKSSTIRFEGHLAFGTLSVESGTHRLVRMSPFNSAGKRQTSFAAVEVIPLIPEATEIEIPETELRIDVYRSSGPGGQSVNTTDSAVRITHLPTGIVVSMQNEKSQLQNKLAAMRVLQSRLLVMRREEEAAKKKQLAGVITASWGDQMRSYVLAPYQLVKDLRTDYESGSPQAVLDGDIDGFISAGIRYRALTRD